MSNKKIRLFAKISLALLFCLTLLLLFIWYANVVTKNAGAGKIYAKIELVPAGRVGLIFGCNPKISGRDNLYFTARIAAANTLWKAGKVDGFIVSGDNSRNSYNEPESMKKALMELGVPAKNICCDYAGLRTFDSVLRAKQIFGVEKVIFVSQRFQNERAHYIADSCGLDSVSFVARDVTSTGGYKTKLRELLARPKMLLDLHMLGTEPKYLGKKELLPFHHGDE